MSFTIRPARSTDLEFLVEGNAALCAETEGRQLDRARLTEGVALALADPSKGRYFVADDGDGPVGQLLVTREWSDWRAGWFWWIASVYVLPDARDGGVFRALYEHVRDAARADPLVCGLRLYVEPENTRAQAVYLRVGMQDAHYRVFEEDFRPPTQDASEP
jgi:ribosomal protein S18 acetylase RimI-like enzyme